MVWDCVNEIELIAPLGSSAALPSFLGAIFCAHSAAIQSGRTTVEIETGN